MSVAAGNCIDELNREWGVLRHRQVPADWPEAGTLGEVLGRIADDPDRLLGQLLARQAAGDRLAARVVLQAMLALNSAMCFTLVWLLWTRNRAALLLGVLYVVLGVVSQAGMFWYVSRLGSQVDMLSLGLWLGEAIFWFCIVGYLYWLKSRGVLR